MRRKETVLRRILVGELLILMVCVIWIFYVAAYYGAKPYSSDVMMVENADYIVFGNSAAKKGFIFYPGAKVEPYAYAPVLSQLAERGICCVVVKMPCNLAFLDQSAAERVMEELGTVEQWYIGGHSLGGAMAASYAAGHEELFQGVILLAAYPTAKIDTLPVLSVYGSRDGVLNRKKYDEFILLATHLAEAVIEGGNHAGFGNYGEQKGDEEAGITREEQWEATVNMLSDFTK